MGWGLGLGVGTGAGLGQACDVCCTNYPCLSWVHSRHWSISCRTLGGVRAQYLVRIKGQLVWDIRHSLDRMHVAGGYSLQLKNELACFSGGQGGRAALMGERPLNGCQLDGAVKTCSVSDVRCVLKSVIFPGPACSELARFMGLRLSSPRRRTSSSRAGEAKLILNAPNLSSPP